MSGIERRHFSRVGFQARAELLSGSRRWDCELLDISLKGALIAPFDAGAEGLASPATLCITLDDGESRIEMQVAIAHREPDRIGLECKLIDIDSIGHLKRLLELNLGDPSLVHRELAALGQPATTQ